MAKRFQTKPGKDAARKRGQDHLSGGKKAKGKAKDDLGLQGGETGKASAENIKLHFDELIKKKKSANSTNQKVRAQNAVAKKDNVDTNILSKIVGWADKDPGEVHDLLKETLRYVETCLPLVQMDLFDSDEDASALTREAQIFDEGFRAGRDARGTADDNPHTKGSVQHEIWADGYMFGQKKNASLIGKTASKDSLGAVPGAKPEERDPLTGSAKH